MNQHALVHKIQPNGRPMRSQFAVIAPVLERRCFEFDRDAIVRQMDLIRKTIEHNAEDLGMVALEGVFEKPLSDDLLRASRALLALGRELKALRQKAMHASGYPGFDKKLS